MQNTVCKAEFSGIQPFSHYQFREFWSPMKCFLPGGSSVGRKQLLDQNKSLTHGWQVKYDYLQFRRYSFKIKNWVFPPKTLCKYEACMVVQFLLLCSSHRHSGLWFKFNNADSATTNFFNCNNASGLHQKFFL